MLKNMPNPMGKIFLRDGYLSQNTDLAKETIKSYSKCLKQHQGKLSKESNGKDVTKDPLEQFCNCVT